MLSWVPNVLGIITMLAVGGKRVASVPSNDPTPASAASIMTFMSTVVVFIVSWCAIAPEYSVFHSYKASRYCSQFPHDSIDSHTYSTKIFLYAYLGLLTSSVS